MLDMPAGPLRTTAALGLAKLVHAGALRSSNLLAKLLLVYFDGSYGVDADLAARRQAAELAQQLSVFFAASGRAAGVATALLPAVRTVFAAADGSREASISVEGVISFVLGLAADGIADTAEGSGAVSAKSAAPCAHAQLCASFCCEALLHLEHESRGHRVSQNKMWCDDGRSLASRR